MITMTQFEQEFTKIKPSLLQLLAALTNLVNSIGEHKTEIIVNTKNVNTPAQVEQENKMYTEAELSKALGISAFTVRRWRLGYSLPVIKVGGRFFYKMDSVNEWLKANEKSGHKAEEPHEIGVIRRIRV